MKNVIAALGLVDWEAQFVSGLGHPMFGLQVQRRCVDGVDIRAAIQVSDCQAVLVSDATPRINQDLIAELADKNIKLIAIKFPQTFYYRHINCIWIHVNFLELWKTSRGRFRSQP